MRRFRLPSLLVVPLLLALPVTALAQGSRKDDIVLNRLGQPVAGASVTVCLAGATGTPCSPLAAVFSDIALTQPLANPLTSDGQGNYHFYAAPGRYVIQFSGAGVAATTLPDVLLPADPTAPAFQSLTVAQNISALNLNLAGNLNVSGGLSSPSTISAPQQGSTAPVQIGANWYPGTAAGLVTPPAAGPGLSNESTTGGTIAGGQSIYCVDVYENRNGTTTGSPEASIAVPAGTNTNRVTAVVGSDLNWRTGAYAFRVYCGTTSGGPYFLQQQQILSVNVASASSAGLTNQVLITTSSPHGLWSGLTVTLAGITGCTGNPNGTFIVQRSDSNTTFLINLSGGVTGCTASTGTASWTNEVNANHAHTVQGYFIMSQLNTSGPTPPATNTAAIDPLQVALNSSCPSGGPAANLCSGVLVFPSAGATLTTPLIVSNQQRIAGPSSVRTGTGVITANWADPWTAAVMVIAANSFSMDSFSIASRGNGLMLFSTNTNERFTNGSIASIPSGHPGLYAAVRVISTTGQVFSIRFEDVYLAGDRASVFVTNSIGLNLEFNGSRWDDFAGGFASESGPTDVDRNTSPPGLGTGIGGVTFKNLFTESGNGVVFDCRNISCQFDNVNPSDSSPAPGTPSIIRLGVDSWGAGGGGNFTSMKNVRLVSNANYGAAVQYVANAGNSLGPQIFENVAFGGNTVCIDEGGVLGGTPLQLVNVTQCDPTPGAGHIINTSASFSGLASVGASQGAGPSGLNSYPTIVGRQFTVSVENGGTSKWRHWFIDTATNSWFCLNPPGNFTINAVSQADACHFSGGFWIPNLRFGTAAGSAGYGTFAGSFTAPRTITWPDASGTAALVLSGTTASLGGSALAAGACSSTTVGISGATTAMAAVASPAADPGAGFYWPAFVSAANTVTVRVCAGAAGTPVATTYNVRVIQ